MKDMDISEYAYKNGYEAGYKKGVEDGKTESIKRGYWFKTYGTHHGKYGCSVCHRTADLSKQGKNYCSYCGSFNAEISDSLDEPHTSALPKTVKVNGKDVPIDTTINELLKKI